MRFWTGLYADGDPEMLIDGVNVMLKIAVKLLTKPARRQGTSRGFKMQMMKER
jgi:hypothetical protein